MHFTEGSSLLHANRSINNGLSVVYAIICIVDVFGVFPVVALPKAVIDCGYYGILVIVIVCSVQMFTATLLTKCWLIAEDIYPNISQKSRYPYAALAEATFGKHMSYFVTFLLDLTVFGGSIPNLIVASQTLELLGLRISENSIDVSFCYWILILGLGLCPVLWLGSPKDMKVLCSLSVCIVSSVFLLTCGCLLFTTITTLPSSQPLDFDSNRSLWKSLLSAYGIIAFQFDIHPTILTIQVDMKEKSKITTAIVGGFLASLSMFGITTIIAAAKYGTTVQPSILDTLPTSIALHFAAALIALQLCLTSAISNSALYQHMEDCLNISREFNYKRCILRTIITLMAIVIAESVPRFDLAMSLIGGTLTAPLMFIFPPLFYIRILALRKRHEEQLAMASFTNIILTENDEARIISDYMTHKFREDFKSTSSVLQAEDAVNNWIWNKKCELMLCIFIISASCFATFGATYLNVTSAALSYANFTRPCLYNISSVLIYNL